MVTSTMLSLAVYSSYSSSSDATVLTLALLLCWNPSSSDSDSGLRDLYWFLEVVPKLGSGLTLDGHRSSRLAGVLLGLLLAVTCPLLS